MLTDPSFDRPKKNLEWVLVVLSSILFGIWAVKETIALRNILFVVGTLFSIYYIVQEWRYGELKEQCTLWKVLPIVLVGLTFFWVISHYLFFSIDPDKQFQELKSTWLRAFMAFVVGLSTGLALRNYPYRLNLLWLGIFVAFLFLLYQYIPRALAQNKLLVSDYDHYLFHLKFNTVLIGMILIAGINGALLDHLRFIHYRLSNLRLWYLIYWLVGTGIVLWAFVYIVDARNGIGQSIIFYSFWFLYVLVFFIQGQIRRPNLRSAFPLIITGAGLSLILCFAYLQTTVNKGWDNFLEDARIAVQIDRYDNWQNLAQIGYPKRKDGQTITNSNYERIAWAIAGSRAIMTYPQGVGILAFPFVKHPQAPTKMVVGLNADGIATHSGWVELGLAFGIPMLALIFSALFLTFLDAARQSHPAQFTVLGFVVLIMCLFTLSEVTTKHGIEILFYLLALMPSLLLTKPGQIESND